MGTGTCEKIQIRDFNGIGIQEFIVYNAYKRRSQPGAPGSAGAAAFGFKAAGFDSSSFIEIEGPCARRVPLTPGAPVALSTWVPALWLRNFQLFADGPNCSFFDFAMARDASDLVQGTVEPNAGCP